MEVSLSILLQTGLWIHDDTGSVQLCTLIGSVKGKRFRVIYRHGTWVYGFILCILEDLGKRREWDVWVHDFYT